MSDAALNELKSILNEIIIKKGGEKSKLVRKFEDKLNGYLDEDKDRFNKKIDGILSNLLNDFAYYQPNPAIRLTDKKLFDDKKLYGLIKEVLGKIDSLQ